MSMFSADRAIQGKVKSKMEGEKGWWLRFIYIYVCFIVFELIL